MLPFQDGAAVEVCRLSRDLQPNPQIIRNLTPRAAAAVQQGNRLCCKFFRKFPVLVHRVFLSSLEKLYTLSKQVHVQIS
jgi:hypothetical protein